MWFQCVLLTNQVVVAMMSVLNVEEEAVHTVAADVFHPVMLDTLTRLTMTAQQVGSVCLVNATQFAMSRNMDHEKNMDVNPH